MSTPTSLSPPVASAPALLGTFIELFGPNFEQLRGEYTEDEMPRLLDEVGFESDTRARKLVIQALRGDGPKGWFKGTPATAPADPSGPVASSSSSRKRPHPPEDVSVPDLERGEIELRDSQGTLLLHIHCAAPGRKWSSLLILLTSSCGLFDVTLYNLVSSNRNIDLSPHDLIIHFGKYIISPAVNSTPDLAPLLHTILPPPKGGRSRSGTQTPSPLGSPNQTRNDDFKASLIARDNGLCAVTRKGGPGYLDFVHGCHVISFAWIKHHEDDIPTALSNLLNDLPERINSICNGILLDVGLHDSFDRGRWGICVDNGSYRFVSLCPYLDCYDARIITFPHTAQTDDLPHPEILNFHLKNSIFYWCRPRSVVPCGSALDGCLWGCYYDDDDVCRVSLQLGWPRDAAEQLVSLVH
eukprot:TRINITY_DN7429_c0_g2_i2.p1 TRINITY_DN7429_c0_g2~~TRINITY_DN7429_c0_g2_i2.p1  ORF type:complete len:412 (-),score=24.60 TRINITY_DN7429_c0_g2_i2:37-1272(-)